MGKDKNEIELLNRKLKWNIDEISKLYPRPEYIFTIDINSARLAAKKIPDSKILSILYVKTDFIYETFMEHLTDLQEVYESLIDETSRRTFCCYWFDIIANRFSDYVFANTTHYFVEGFFPKDGGIVIDCGACDGLTATKFAGLGYKVYGFEMDKINFEIAKKLAAEKGFIVENFGLGSYTHEMKYTHVEGNIGASNLNSDGTETARIITLDSYVSEKRLPSVDFIKMDVEGAELDVLRGAADTIARFKPILALSAYHKFDDLWTLMNFVKSVRSDYEFALRQYGETERDLSFINKNTLEALYNLGLEPNTRGPGEIVLFAR